MAAHITVDDNYVYWTNCSNDGQVMKIPREGGTPIVLAENQTYPTSVKVNGTHAYWATRDGDVKRIPLAGGTPTILVSGEVFPFGVAIDANHVYWTNYADPGMVKKLRLN